MMRCEMCTHPKNFMRGVKRFMKSKSSSKNPLKVIILEGAYAVGKTEISNRLRERIPHSHLFRLSDIDYELLNTRQLMIDYYKGLFNFIESQKGLPAVFIFDRFFLSEQVYSHLYKPYSFMSPYIDFMEELSNSTYPVTTYLIEVDNEQIYNRVLKRNKFMDKPERLYTEALNQMEVYRSHIGLYRERIPTVVLSNNTEGDLESIVNTIVNSVYDDVVKEPEEVRVNRNSHN